MENLTHKLDFILEKTQKMQSDFKNLKSEKQKLEVQFSHLKVEADHYKKAYLHLKKEQEEANSKEVKNAISVEDDKPKTDPKLLMGDTKPLNTMQIKDQLNGLIEDINQCIQIIQAK